MAKVKLLHFEVLSLLSESKKLIEFLQRCGCSELEDVTDEELTKYRTETIVKQFEKKREKTVRAYEILEKHCELKKSLLESFSDCKEISYNDYKLLSDKADEILSACDELLFLESENERLKGEILHEQAMIAYYEPWIGLDIPMASKRTMTTNVFVGTFGREYTAEEILSFIKESDGEIEDVAVQVVSKRKMLTCAVIVCHQSSGGKVEEILKSKGFSVPDKIAPSLPEKAIEDCRERIKEKEKQAENIKSQIELFKDNYDEIRFFSDYLSAQKEKYIAVENAATSEMTFVVRGYLPERKAEEIKFEIERRFTAQTELSEPDYEGADVPVLIENGSFAAGVESITDMYSHPSNKDVDPNPVMSFFYYAFFGLMLSDAGYGFLMVIFAIFAKKKLKVTGNMKKNADMVLYSGISTVIWGALFGGWFGDLIPTICTTFLGFETAPSLAIWLEPMNNSMELLMYCFIFGVIHLLAGNMIRFYSLVKEKNYVSAIFDVIPVCIFLIGFAIFGGGFIFTISDSVKKWGMPLLAAGALLIVLTAGRSSKNIVGKLGGGLYALYNTASGYLGDVLSYSRLLALGLVTGVIANVVNLLAAMFGNIFAFIIIFLIGHIINIAINLIGTYVHTNRLQYVEFFSKFYEGQGRNFSPFKINSKFFTIKEDK